MATREIPTVLVPDILNGLGASLTASTTPDVDRVKNGQNGAAVYKLGKGSEHITVLNGVDPRGNALRQSLLVYSKDSEALVNVVLGALTE